MFSGFRARARARVTNQNKNHTHYSVSGGPMTVICHSNRLESSTRPAEKPSTGFLASSVVLRFGWWVCERSAGQQVVFSPRALFLRAARELIGGAWNGNHTHPAAASSAAGPRGPPSVLAVGRRSFCCCCCGVGSERATERRHLSPSVALSSVAAADGAREASRSRQRLARSRARHGRDCLAWAESAGVGAALRGSKGAGRKVFAENQGKNGKGRRGSERRRSLIF